MVSVQTGEAHEGQRHQTGGDHGDGCALEIDGNVGALDAFHEGVDRQIGDLRERLHKLYDALETGKLGIDELAPRIRELKARIGELEKQRNSFVEDLESEEVELLSAPAVKEYADDLRSLLSRGSIMEQKSFLRSFVKRIEVNLPDVTIDYTIPLESKKVEPLAREVLPFAQNGSPGRTRTCGTVVNSHLLYRLSYRGMQPSLVTGFSCLGKTDVRERTEYNKGGGGMGNQCYHLARGV